MWTRSLLSVAVLAAWIGAPQPVATQQSVDIREWPVPWEESRPRDPYVGPEGRVWFVGQRADYAAYLDPETGEFTRYDLPEGAGPHNLIVAENGTVWYAGNRDRHIGRIDPESGEIEVFEMPDPEARDPHTLIWHGDRILFTLQGANMIGRLDTASGAVELADVPTPQARPYGINAAPDGTVWVAELGTNKLLRDTTDETPDRAAAAQDLRGDDEEGDREYRRLVERAEHDAAGDRQRVRRQQDVDAPRRRQGQRDGHAEDREDGEDAGEDESGGRDLHGRS